MPSLPTPFKAAVGLAFATLDELRLLPGRAMELPLTALSTVLSTAARAQQRYTQLAARGDAALSRTPTTERLTTWDTFEMTQLDGMPAAKHAADWAPTTSRRPSPRPVPAKTIRPPRTGAPSKFDAATFEDDDSTT
jgi:hypothetical protein